MNIERYCAHWTAGNFVCQSCSVCLV